MKQDERGFTTIEVIVASAIMAFICSAAAMSTFRVISDTERGNSHVAAVQQVQNIGQWISRDAHMAQSITVDNLDPPNFIVMTWSEQNYDGGDPTYHSVTYFFEDMSGAVGKLKRSHWSSDGANEETLVATHIYYDPGDVDNTSKADYQSPVLTVQLTTVFGEAIESRQYRICHRPNI